MTRTEAIVRRLIEIKGEALEHEVLLAKEALDAGGVWISVPKLQPMGCVPQMRFEDAWGLFGFVFRKEKKRRKRQK